MFASNSLGRSLYWVASIRGDDVSYEKLILAWLNFALALPIAIPTTPLTNLYIVGTSRLLGASGGACGGPSGGGGVPQIPWAIAGAPALMKTATAASAAALVSLRLSLVFISNLH